MANQLYHELGNQCFGMDKETENLVNMIQQFNQFRNGYQGNAKQEVMNLLQSGQMSQQQLNHLQQIANRLMPLCGM